MFKSINTWIIKLIIYIYIYIYIYINNEMRSFLGLGSSGTSADFIRGGGGGGGREVGSRRAGSWSRKKR